MRIGEDGVGDVTGRDLDGRVRVENVVSDRRELGIGVVLELDSIGHIPDGPDVVDVGAQLLVGGDETEFVCRHAGGGHVQQIGVRDPAGGHEQGVPDQIDDPVLDQHLDSQAVIDFGDPGHGAVEVNVHAFPIELGEPGRNLTVLVEQQAIASSHHRNPRAETSEDVSHLGRHEATADDDQVLGEPVEAHDRCAGVVRDPVEALDRRDKRASARSEDEPVATYLRPVDCESVLVDELGRAGVDVDVRLRLPIDDALRPERVDPPEHPVSHIRPAGAVEVGVHPERTGSTNRLGDVGGVDEHLRRNAPTIEAGTAEDGLLHDRHAPVVEVAVDDGVAGAGGQASHRHGRRHLRRRADRFRGHDVNTAERALASVAQHGLSDLAVGHDPGRDGSPPDIMRNYRTGGTPWTVIIGPERRVCFDGFQIDPDTATAIVGQLSR